VYAPGSDLVLSREIAEWIRDGRLEVGGAILLVVIALNSDPETGKWKGTGGLLMQQVSALTPVQMDAISDAFGLTVDGITEVLVREAAYESRK
jgi:hypothetical protein